MLVNRKLKYLVSTPFGLLDLKAKEVKNKTIHDIRFEYENMAYWLNVFYGKITKPSYKEGKWMLFVKEENLEDCWNKLLEGMNKKVFTTMKCSIPNENNPHNVPGVAAIMVYTYDYQDTEDIKKVLKFLLDNGLDYGEELQYKADYQTRQSKYEGGRGESWLYSSKDFEF